MVRQNPADDMTPLGPPWPSVLMPLYPWWQWLSAYPPLFLIVLTILLLCWDQLAQKLGAANLFWHDVWWTQLFAGGAVTLLFAQVCFVGYVLGLRDGWIRTVPLNHPVNVVADWLFDRLGVPEDSDWRPLGWYLFFAWLPLLVLVPLGHLLAHLLASDAGSAHDGVGPTWFIVGELLGIAVTAGGLALFGNWLSLTLFGWSVRWQLPEDTSESEVSLHATAATLFAVFFVLYLLFVLFQSVIPLILTPALVLCVLFALFVSVYGAVVFNFPTVQFPVFVAMLGLLIAINGCQPYKVSLPGLEGETTQPLDEYDDKLRAYLKDQSKYAVLQEEETGQLAAWKTGTGQDRPILIVVATSGGGIRAGVWTVRVLTKLEREFEQRQPGSFPRQVRLITGASGGMVGASYYVADLDPKTAGHYPTADGPRNKQRADRLFQAIARESLTPVARRLVLWDVPLGYWPLPYMGDRGTALEEAWEEADATFTKKFDSLKEGEAAGWRPSLILSPMGVQDGRRVLVTNLKVPYLLESVGENLSPAPADKVDPQQRLIGTRSTYSVSAVEMFHLFPGAREKLKVSTAARANATFPYISPQPALPTEPRWKLADAGYYDNYGVNLATRWIYAHRDWLLKNTGGVLLIQIRDSESEDRRKALAPRGRARGVAPADRTGSGLEFALAPANTFLVAADASSEFRNDEQLEVLDDYFNDQAAPGPTRFFNTAVFERPGVAALNWYLTPAEKAAIHLAMDPTEALPEELQPQALSLGEPAKQKADERAAKNRASLTRLFTWWEARKQAPAGR